MNTQIDNVILYDSIASLKSWGSSNDPDNKVHGAKMVPTWVLPAPWTLLSGEFFIENPQMVHP